VNHDALFKMLLKTPVVLKGFFEAFLPQVGKFVDFNALEFVDKERFTSGGRKRTGDILVKTRLRSQDAAFLIHLEHQAQPATAVCPSNPSPQSTLGITVVIPYGPK